MANLDVLQPPKRQRKVPSTIRSSQSLIEAGLNSTSTTEALLDTIAPLPLPSQAATSSSFRLFTLPLFEDASKVERRWQAVMIAVMRETELNRPLSLHERSALAQERKIGSGRSLERYIQRVKGGIPLDPKKPTGRKPHVLNQVNEFMKGMAQSFNYHFSHEVMSLLVKEQHKIGSPSTVGRVLKKKHLDGRPLANA
jgi:hypothetical protein